MYVHAFCILPLQVVAPEAKKGETWNWFFAVKSLNGSLTPTTRFSMCSKQKQPKGLFTKYIRSPWFLMLSFGVGQGWLQNVFLFLFVYMYESNFEMNFRFLFMLRTHPRVFTSQKEKERRKNGKKWILRWNTFFSSLKKTAEETCWKRWRLRQKKLEELVFHFCTEILSYSPLYIAAKRKLERKWIKISQVD